MISILFQATIFVNISQLKIYKSESNNFLNVNVYQMFTVGISDYRPQNFRQP